LTFGCNNFNDFSENQLPKFHQIGMAAPYQISDFRFSDFMPLPAPLIVVI